MGKTIKVMVQDKNTIILCEDAKSGDIIDLKEVNQLDTDFIEQLIELEKDQVYNKKIKELRLALEKEKELAVEFANTKASALAKEQTREAVIQEQNKYHQLEIAYAQLKAEWNAKMSEKELEVKTAVNQEMLQLKQTIASLQQEMQSQLQFTILKKDAETIQALSELKEKHHQELAEKEEMINKLSRQKASLNVKQTGEDLEIWCDNEVNEQMQNGFFNCTWNKDNTVVKEDDEKKGSKADYIFKVYATEAHLDEDILTSVCLEMKDENPDSVNKQTNEHYYKALDKNRLKKNCKFALLVSNLENDKPNALPIFKVREYPDMYVVRPPYLMTFLHMVTSLAMRYKELILKHTEEKLELKNQLEFIDEFNQIKKTYLETPLNQLQKHIDTILKANETITKANDSIHSACDEIITKYINGIQEKLNRFDAKLTKGIKKIN